MQNVKKIKKCRVCGSPKITTFFDLGRQPLANSLLKKPAAKEKKYPLQLSHCADCSLVQLNHTVSPEKLFSDYVWVTGTSKGANDFAFKFRDMLLSRKKIPPAGLVLEIASNDGTFLKPFQEKGFTVLGIDPAKNIAKMAVLNGVPTEVVFFGVSSAKNLLEKHGPAEAVFARNVLPHVAQTRDFVAGLAIVLKKDGVVAIEAHYADVILKELHYDSIYHEHLCYFTLKSIERLLNDFGLFVFDIEKSPISGGSIIVYASKEKVAVSATVKKFRTDELKDKINSLSEWKKFAKRAFGHRVELLNAMNSVHQKSGSVFAYGASARSSTMLNFCGISSKQIVAIFDQNPLKQGLYTAGSHIRIVNPEEITERKPDNILLLAWNFKDEIMSTLKEQFNYKGGYIIPLPGKPRIIKA